MLYVDLDKKRTNTWLRLNRLQLPLGVKYGSSGSVAHIYEKVNSQNAQKSGNSDTLLNDTPKMIKNQD